MFTNLRPYFFLRLSPLPGDHPSAAPCGARFPLVEAGLGGTPGGGHDDQCGQFFFFPHCTKNTAEWEASGNAVVTQRFFWLNYAMKLTEMVLFDLREGAQTGGPPGKN